MSELTARAQQNLNKTLIQPLLILEVEGLPPITSGALWKIPRFDDPDLFFDMPDFRFDDVIEDKRALHLIDMPRTTSTLTQQIFPDQGVANSVTSMSICLVDKNQIMTKAVAPGFVLDDILSKKAVVYLSHGKAAHPEDSIPVLYGVVQGTKSGPGDMTLRVTHPDGLKRQDIFTKIQMKTVTRFRYRSKRINGVNYQTQDRVVGFVTIAMISGGTKGSEEVTVVGNAITIKANTTAANPADRSAASNIVSAIQKVQAAVNLVDVENVEDENATPQAAFGATTLDSDTELEVDQVGGVLTPSQDLTLRTYVRVADEIIEYTSIEGNRLKGLARGCFDTIPQTYEDDEEVATHYRLMGAMKDIALKIMLSQGASIENVPVTSFVRLDGVTDLPNAIVLGDPGAMQKYGITIGDFISSKSAGAPANNFELRKIVNLESTDFGTVITIDGAGLEVEEDTVAQLSFKSKYNVWPDGLAMQLDQVDVARHEELIEFFPTEFFEYDFILDDTIKGDEFLEKEIYRPSGCFAIPRRGRSSVGKTMPPLTDPNTVKLDENNIVDPSQITVERSFSDNFYNSLIYNFEEDPVERKFTRGVVRLFSDSLNRIKNVKNIPYKIESAGLRDTPETREKIELQNRRIRDRYQYGAELIADVPVFYKDGIGIEVGSTVIFGSAKLMISDSSNGSRKFRPRVMEVINARKNIYAGTVSLTLLDTAFAADAKYGVIAPGSLIDEGATVNRLPLKKGLATGELENETSKWKQFVGQPVIVRSYSWDVQYLTVFRGFDVGRPNVMIVNPPLPNIPLKDFVVETAPYDDSSPEAGDLWKAVNVFFNPTANVVSSPSANQIEVSSEDVQKFRLRSPVEIHNEDWSKWTKDLGIYVTDITDNVLTLSRSVDFPVTAGFVIELIGFKDGGMPYRSL